MKKFNKGKNCDVLVKIMWIFFILFTLTEPLNIPIVFARIFSYITLIIGLIITYFAFFDLKLFKKDALNLLLLIFISLFCLISVLDTKYNNLNLNYYIKYLKFLSVISSWFWGRYMVISKNSINFILKSNIFLGFIYVILYFVNPNYLYKYVTLGMSNPNSTAILLFYNIIFIIIWIYNNKNNVKSGSILLIRGLSIFLIYILYLTYSRTALICLVLFLVYLIFVKFMDIKKIYLYFSIIIPILFIIFYIYLYESGKVAYDYILLGKEFFSLRESFWIQIWQSLKGNLLIGHYSDYNSQMLHNSQFDLLIQYGYIVLILTIVYLCRILGGLVNEANKSIISKIAFFAIMMALVSGCTESSVLDGGLAVYVCTGSLLLFVRNICNEEILD